MAEERKKYDKEFKLKVVEVSFARGKVKEVAEEYGIAPQMLATWRSQYKNHKEIAFPGNGRKMQTEAEKGIIEIEQYHTFLDFLNGVKNIPSKVSEFKNGEFEMVSKIVG